MRIENQTNPERTKLGELVSDISTVMLTFVNESGALVSQPMGPVKMDSEGVIWFFTDIASAKVKHLSTLNLSFSNEPDGVYVSLAGHGEMDLDRDRLNEMWTPFAKPWFPDGPESPNLGLLKFIPHTAEYWDTPHSKVVRLFAMAASIVAAKPIGLGEHDTLTNL